MCPATTTAMAWTMFALSAASTATSVIGQQIQANEQADYQEDMAEQRNRQIAQNADAANKSYIEETHTQNVRLQQEQEAASQEIQDINRENLERQGTSVAAGIGMLDALQMEYDREAGRYKSAVEKNFDYSLFQVGQQKKQSRARAVDRMNSIQPYTPQPINQPNYIGAGLQIGQAGLGAYNWKKTHTPESKGGWQS